MAMTKTSLFERFFLRYPLFINCENKKTFQMMIISVSKTYFATSNYIFNLSGLDRIPGACPDGQVD